MNAIQRNWNLMDYARSYALAGNEHYRMFLNYLDEYPIPGTTLMYYLLGKQAKFANRDFRMGKFKVQDDRKRVNDMLEHLADLGKDFYYWRDYDFAAAVLTIQNVEGYDPQRMLTKLKEDPKAITRQASRIDYLRLLESIYNRKFSDENRLRFF